MVDERDVFETNVNTDGRNSMTGNQSIPNVHRRK